MHCLLEREREREGEGEREREGERKGEREREGGRKRERERAEKRRLRERGGRRTRGQSSKLEAIEKLSNLLNSESCKTAFAGTQRPEMSVIRHPKDVVKCVECLNI